MSHRDPERPAGSAPAPCAVPASFSAPWLKLHPPLPPDVPAPPSSNFLHSSAMLRPFARTVLWIQ